MTRTIDMQGMRYLNLFEKITRVRTKDFFSYNNMIIFCVPKPILKKALGKDNSNLKKISDIIKKRIRIVPTPRGIEDIDFFISAIISPVDFQELNVKNDEVVLTAGQSKAALLGRNKRRLIEMQKIVKDYFGKEFRVA